MDVLEKIDALRKERGWSVNKLAVMSGLTQSTLNNVYARKTEPKISTLRAICDAFSISLSDFFSEDAVKDELLSLISSLSEDGKLSLLTFIKSLKR